MPPLAPEHVHVQGQLPLTAEAVPALHRLVVGAVLVGGLQEYIRVTISSAVNVLVAGVLLVFFVIVAPQGIVGLFQRKK